MRVLELFKGSGSITKYYQDTDTEVVSLDILEMYDNFANFAITPTK